jgi:hypothetical protein
MSAFQFQRFEVFGWIVHRKSMEKGDKYQVSVPADVKPIDSGNVTLWTKGLIRGLRQDGYTPAQRKAGTFSLDFDLFHWGAYVFEALEDSEWWCVNWAINGRQLPDLKAFRLENHHKVVIPSGTRMLI